MLNGKLRSGNSKEPDQFLNEVSPLISSTWLCGLSTQKWRCETSSFKVHAMFGNGLVNTCLGLNSFGTNMPWWKKCWENLIQSEGFLKTGWLGNLQSSLGTLTSSLNKDTETSINAESFLKSLLIWIQSLPASSKQQTLRSIKRTLQQPDSTSKGLSLNWANVPSTKLSLFHLPSSKSGNMSMKEQKSFMSTPSKTCQKTLQKVFKSNL